MHRRSWVCQLCNERFYEKDFMVSHLQIKHLTGTSAQQLTLALEISERPVSEDNIFPCPLCPNELRIAVLMDHLAGHMEDISLFALPSQKEHGLDDASDENFVKGDGHQESYEQVPSNTITRATEVIGDYRQLSLIEKMNLGLDRSEYRDVDDYLVLDQEEERTEIGQRKLRQTEPDGEHQAGSESSYNNEVLAWECVSHRYHFFTGPPLKWC